jgi:two-component system, cell cycle response regulator
LNHRSLVRFLSIARLLIVCCCVFAGLAEWPWVRAFLLLGTLGVVHRSLRLGRIGFSTFGSSLFGLVAFYTLFELIGTDGGGVFYGLIYLWVGAVAFFGPLRESLLVLAGVLGVEGLRWVRSSQDPSHGAANWLAHLGFAVLVTAMVQAAQRRQAQQASHERRKLDSHLRRERALREEQRDTLPPAEWSTVKGDWLTGALDRLLTMAAVSLKASRAVFFVSNVRRPMLSVRAAASEKGPFPWPGERDLNPSGVLGAALRSTVPLRLSLEKGNLKYPVPWKASSVLLARVVIDPDTTGLLAVDRADGPVFEATEEGLLDALLGELAEAFKMQGAFNQIEQARYEHERFYEAFALLNACKTVDEVSARLMDAALRIKECDFVAVGLFDAGLEQHQMVAVRAQDTDLETRLRGQTFAHRDSPWISMAFKNLRPMPFVPLSEQDDAHDVRVFGGLKVPRFRAVKIFPMIAREKPLGFLCLASTTDVDEILPAEETMLATVARHGALTLENAQMYDRLERLATTDGLTGVLNHRRLKELLEESMSRARRYKRTISVLMVDADHFKSVNDTYGHPVGDLVLKGIATILMDEARETDIVARYGGEEFVVVLDETDGDAARGVAERIRQRVQDEVFEGDFGRLSITMSLGLSTWRTELNKTMEELLECADQALYEAKKSGRNRVISFEEMGRRKAPRPGQKREQGVSSIPSQVPA